jgi:hypothetical protein
MKDEIILSPKHGLNPSLLKCFACGKDAGIALLGELKNDEEAPWEMTDKTIFCNNCQNVINQDGLLVISVRDGETGNNPFRTGKLVGITKEAKERIFKDIKTNVCYMEDSVFDKIFNISENEENN